MFNATFNNISAISSQLEDPEKTHDLSQVTAKCVHIFLSESRIHNMSGDGH